jgi:hypothetical protein
MNKNSIKIFWSETPGRFVNKTTGLMTGAGKNPSPEFSTDPQFWWNTVLEPISEICGSTKKPTLHCGEHAYRFLSEKIELPKNIKLIKNPNIDSRRVHNGYNCLEILA